MKTHAKMNLATEIHHTDFSYHCKDFRGKECHVFEFYAGASSAEKLLLSWVPGPVLVWWGQQSFSISQYSPKELLQ